ncbi:MAG: peptide-binding protein [Candidatus Omnitrophica bacterium]|nr:peptide-binding protein [Candidatus Omnitrophota bacterium]
MKKIAVFIITCFLFSHCLTSAQEVKDTGDTIVVGSIGDARSLIPILASDSASGDIVGLVFNGLIKYDKDINLIGDLAESWQIAEGGLVIIFKLRKNVRWHDGTPFSARDVEFTFRKLIDPDVKTPYSGDFQKVKAIEVIDEYTLKVTYKEPFSPGLSSWGMGIMPKHILENEDFNNTSFSRNPIGTGPYKFKFWKTQEKIVLEANEAYFQSRPFIDRYIYRIIPDQATLFLEAQVEGVDLSGLTPFQYKRQTDTAFFKNTFNKYRLPSFGFTYLGFNLKNPLFKDKKVRQALDYALDKNEIIKGVLLGLGRVCTGPFVPDSWAYNQDISVRDFNQDKARHLLKGAGWQDTDRDGWLDREGKRFEFTIITNQGNEQRKAVAEIIQKRLADIGIKVKIKIIEWSAFISEFIDKRKFDAVLLGWSLSRDPDNYDIWHSSKTREGEFNFISYNNKKVDDLLVKGRRTFNQAERARLYKEIHEIIYEDAPYIFLYVPDSLPIVHKRFKGIKPEPLGIGYNFIKWWVPDSEQKYIRSRIKR